MSNAPKTKAEYAAFRCKTACRIGVRALQKKIDIPPGLSPVEYAIYNLLNAVEDLSIQLEEFGKPHD